MKANSKISTIIIEDIIEAQEYLTSILNKNCKTIDILGYSTTIHDSIKLIKSVKPELVFMDIELADGNAFEIFKHLTSHNFEVIFVTAFDGFIQKAIDHFALSYIVKPIDENKLIASVNRYIEQKERLFNLTKLESFSNFIAHDDSKFLIQTGHEHISINIKDIVKLEAQGNFTSLFLEDNKTYLASHNLKYYEELLVHKGFFRPHRSLIINTRCIKSVFKKETIILISGEKIHVSARNKSKLTEMRIMVSFLKTDLMHRVFIIRERCGLKKPLCTRSSS